MHLKVYENLKRNVKRNTKVELKREQHLMIYGVWKIHNSQVAGPSHRISHSLFDDCSDSTVEDESNEGRDYDTIHPPSPKISKGGIGKKSRKQPIMQDMSNTHNASLIDIHSTAGHSGDRHKRKSQPEENAAYDSDVAM